jgi:uncharacterized protein YozE (UPF0346 family)
MPISFLEYLRTRRPSFTQQGDFVAEAQRDPDFPDPKTWHELNSFLIGRGATPDLIAAARSVWRQYRMRHRS